MSTITETTASDLAGVTRRHARKGSVKAIVALLVAALAATILAASGSAADRFIPGVTDFPSASQSEPYVPFVTDFPSRTPVVATDDEAHMTGSFDGHSSAFAVAIGLALLALAAASRPALRRRRSMSSA
jgi:hypothetical protein